MNVAKKFLGEIEELGYRADLIDDRIIVSVPVTKKRGLYKVLYISGVLHIPPRVTFRGDFINIHYISFWDIPKDTEFDGIQKVILKEFRTDDPQDFDLPGIDSMRLFKSMVKRLGA